MSSASDDVFNMFTRRPDMTSAFKFADLDTRVQKHLSKVGARAPPQRRRARSNPALSDAGSATA